MICDSIVDIIGYYTESCLCIVGVNSGALTLGEPCAIFEALGDFCFRTIDLHFYGRVYSGIHLSYVFNRYLLWPREIGERLSGISADVLKIQRLLSLVGVLRDSKSVRWLHSQSGLLDIHETAQLLCCESCWPTPLFGDKWFL